MAAAGRLLLAAGLLLGLARCDWSGPPADETEVVVEAFLETGQPFPPIVLRQTTALSGNGGEASKAATGADVVLTHDDMRVPYHEDDQTAGRYEPTVSGVVKARMPWSLTVRWKQDTARAQGRTAVSMNLTEVCVEVPSEPVQAVQVDSLRRDSLDIPATRDLIFPMDVTVHWESNFPSASTDTTAWVRAQLRPDTTASSSRLIGFFLEPDEVRREDAFSRVNGGRRWRGVYAVPVDSSVDDLLPRHDLTATLVRGDDAFADYAQTRTDPERREPISNVDGGLGIATAVSVDSVFVGDIEEPGIQKCVASGST
ncbi:MAG: hypothetical protein BRD55_00165 [Bacteroidetes bacterium SW_9_63_38]|nr:MAG: hypothetical protein BRD55_00165 [Bacteroidetes bacterium SW_9_63_38]